MLRRIGLISPLRIVFSVMDARNDASYCVKESKPFRVFCVIKTTKLLVSTKTFQSFFEEPLRKILL